MFLITLNISMHFSREFFHQKIVKNLRLKKWSCWISKISPEETCVLSSLFAIGTENNFVLTLDDIQGEF